MLSRRLPKSCMLIAFIGNSLSLCAQITAPNEWTWMGGSSAIGTACSQVYFCGQVGVYGTQGVASAENVPGGRNSGATWADSNGRLWLFGGAGFDAVGNNFFLNDLWRFDPSTNEWTWMGGSSQINQSGVYGERGTAAAANIPGARIASAIWTDKSGNFWLFGGWGLDANGVYSALNDLWNFDPSKNEWTWMSGGNTVNQSGVYGALGSPSAGNTPGGTYEASSWIDQNGHLWLFGGYAYDAFGILGLSNDLWEFDPSTLEWTWMGGSNRTGTACPAGQTQFCGYAGVYGTLGTPAPENIAGSRNSAFSWVDSSGHAWLFFGIGFDSTGAWGQLDDVWEFDPSTNEWAWMGGYNTLGPLGRHPGVYGTAGTASSNNLPGSRDSVSGWTDNTGNLWIFGGEGWDANSNMGEFNELWEFRPSTNEWTWMGGSNVVGPPDNHGQAGWPGVYGNLGSAAAGNIPGSRADAMSWTDNSGHFWLFGGGGFDSGGNWGYLNDLWEYQPSNTVNVPKADFSLTALATALNVVSSQGASTTITVTPEGGFASSVSFSCSGLPAGAICTFSPTSVVPTGAAASTTLTVTTSATAEVLRDRVTSLSHPAELAVVFFGLCWMRRRRVRLLSLLLFACLGFVTACGGGSGAGNGTRAGPSSTANLLVTAISGSLQHSITVSLTVN